MLSLFCEFFILFLHFFHLPTPWDPNVSWLYKRHMLYYALLQIFYKQSIFSSMPTTYVLLRYIYLCNYARLYSYKVLCIFSEHSPGMDDECTIAAIADGPWILVLGPWSLDLLGSWFVSEELPWSLWGWCDMKGTEAWPAVGVLNNNLILTIRIKEEKRDKVSNQRRLCEIKLSCTPSRSRRRRRTNFA